MSLRPLSALAFMALCPTSLAYAQGPPAAGIPSISTTPQETPGDGVIDLIGVSYSPSEHQTWWGQNGLHATGPPSSLAGHFVDPIVSAPKGQQAREFVFNARGMAADADIQVEVSTASSTLTTTDDEAQGGKFIGIEAALSASARVCTIRVGVAAQPWTAAASEGGGSQLSTGESFLSLLENDKYLATFSPLSTTGNGLVVTVSDTITDQDTRIVAIDTQGRTVVPDTLGIATLGKFTQRTVVFPNLKLQDIKMLQFQARPYHWMEFHDIPLLPSPT